MYLNPSYFLNIFFTLLYISDSYESMEEYELIGLMIGVAIFNSIIIDLKMPMVRLLTGCVPYLPSLSTILTIFQVYCRLRILIPD